MADFSSNNKQIAKNTLFMYLRMFLTMGMGLYTSRVVLNSLGVEDYGLYNVIGGIIAMFGFINGAMTNTTSRYISYYLGHDERMLSKVFSMTFLIHAIIAFLIVFILKSLRTHIIGIIYRIQFRIMTYSFPVPIKFGI